MCMLSCWCCEVTSINKMGNRCSVDSPPTDASHCFFVTHAYKHRLKFGTKSMHLVRGLVKLKKIRDKLGLAKPHSPPPPIPVFFMLETCTKQNTQKYQKTHTEKSELRLEPTTHFRIFLGFYDFFNLTRPLAKSE